MSDATPAEDRRREVEDEMEHYKDVWTYSQRDLDEAIRADREKLLEAAETTKPHLEAWYSKAELRDLIWNTPIGGSDE